jgi:hypothetical protein
MPISYSPVYQPSLEDEPGASFDGRRWGGVSNLRPLRESGLKSEILEPAYPTFSDDEFDDTHKLMQVNRDRKLLREAEQYMSEDADAASYGPQDYGHGSSAQSTPAKASPGHFERGVPTNNATSSKNYSPDHVRIIKGEHVSLLKNGALNEAMDNDNHDQHILEHRYMLSDPNLTETMRSALLEHISQHAKMKKQGMKQVKEDTVQRAKRRMGPGVAARMAGRLNGGSDSKIPQDSPFDAERKRTSGMVSMEAGQRGGSAQNRFAAALKVRRGLH